MFKIQEDSADVQCVHNISTYNTILWYKQSQDRGLTLLGNVYRKTKNKEDKFNKKIELIEGSGVNEKNVITIKNLSVDDTAVYFCAASEHSAIHPVLSSQKLISISHDDR